LPIQISFESLNQTFQYKIKMIKKIIVSACLLLSLVSFAQEGTASPYSYYGIDVRFKGTVENRSMAGVAVEQDSILHSQNPASFANLKMTTLLSEEHITRH
jgi:hypothetical protein